MSYLKFIFAAGFSLLIGAYVHAEKIVETNGNSDGEKINQTVQASDVTILDIDLEKFEMRVHRNEKTIATYPISWGGPEAMPSCDPQTHKGPCPNPPRECKEFSRPPAGEFQVTSTKAKHHSPSLNSGYSHVILFGEGSWVIRAVNPSAPAAVVGSSQFTCGHIVLRSGDAKNLQQRISSSDPKLFKVRVSK